LELVGYKITLRTDALCVRVGRFSPDSSTPSLSVLRVVHFYRPGFRHCLS
jgi:hypothetical protein